MTFSNQLVEQKELPQIDQLEFISVEQDYIDVRRKIAVVVSLVLLALFAVAWLVVPSFSTTLAVPAKIVSSIALGLGLLVSTYCWLADPKKGYVLREHDLSYRSGLLFRKTTTQPITRVQHIEVKQGPIERRYNLACLLAYSAGGQMHTFYIPGLRFEHAKQMRAYILDHKEAVRDEQ